MNRSNLQKIRVWDLPTRLFHWALVALMILLFITAYAGRMNAHAAIGQAVLVLVMSRLVWGFIGSQTSRFKDFVRGFADIRAYLSAGQPKMLGHNPIGALMVLALLGAVFIQAFLGMFSSDGITFHGPFAHWVSSVVSDSITSLHMVLAYVIACLVVTHVVAVLLHWMLRRENLVAAMFSGTKWIAKESSEPKFASSLAALAIAISMTALLFAIRAFS